MKLIGCMWWRQGWPHRYQGHETIPKTVQMTVEDSPGVTSPLGTCMRSQVYAVQPRLSTLVPRPPPSSTPGPWSVELNTGGCPPAHPLTNLGCGVQDNGDCHFQRMEVFPG